MSSKNEKNSFLKTDRLHKLFEEASEILDEGQNASNEAHAWPGADEDKLDEALLRLGNSLDAINDEFNKVLARTVSYCDQAEASVRDAEIYLETLEEKDKLVSKADSHMTTLQAVPIEINDPINAQILAVSEDRIQGFQPDPLAEISRLSGVAPELVLERIVAMLRAGTIRRVRQTLMAINLAPGALVAWQVPEEKLQAAFDWMFQNDPFTGHVVIRSTDAPISGARYRLWTTLKVPQGFSMQRHGEFLCDKTGALAFKLMPARKVFALGVGHIRRKGMEPGSKADEVAEAKDTEVVELSELDWRVLVALKREFEPEELAVENLWAPRAAEVGVPLEEFYRVAQSLTERGVIGRFSTFLEHAKPLQTGERVTRFNALFHWAVPPGRELEAGQQVGRFHIMTHAYWREGGPEFGNVNIMGVAHGTDKDLVLAHKRAIDEHLESIGIPVSYTNVFWGGRSEIKPSEISPIAYREWANAMGLSLD